MPIPDRHSRPKPRKKRRHTSTMGMSGFSTVSTNTRYNTTPTASLKRDSPSTK